MSQPGEQLAAEILDDLACPQCEYNLRGLRGPVVHCPECGVECDIPRMIANKWTRPWWDAPGFNRLVRPLTWLVLSCCGLFVVLIIETSRFRHAPGLTIFLAVAVFIVWIVLLAMASREFDDERGFVLTAFLHLLFAGYLGGVIGIGVLAIGAITSGQWALALPQLIGVVMLGVVLYLCRKGERYVAEQCLKRHLQNSTA